MDGLLKAVGTERRRRLLRELRRTSMTASEMAMLVGVPMPNLGRDFVDPMTEAGLIEVYIDSKDSRRKLYRTTNLGNSVDDFLAMLEGFGEAGPSAMGEVDVVVLEDGRDVTWEAVIEVS